MVIKWITCRVQAEGREAFHRSQLGWDRLAGWRGFRGQVGGWVDGEADTAIATACIVAFWRDLESYHDFHRHAGHELLESPGQRSLHLDVEVHLLQPRLGLEGSHRELDEAVPLARWLRLLDSRATVENLDDLLERQRRIWAPGLPVLQGLLSGAFATGLDNEIALAATFWQDRQSVDLYHEHIYPRLLKRAGAPPFPGANRLRLIRLEPGWRVPAVNNN